MLDISFRDLDTLYVKIVKCHFNSSRTMISGNVLTLDVGQMGDNGSN